MNRPRAEAAPPALRAGWPRRRTTAAVLMAAALALAVPTARADAVDTLREFVRDVKSGRAAFTQTVTSPDGQKKRSSSGSFEFQRPNRFRFAYAKPYQQLIVGDGQKVWIYDADLNQVSVRRMAQALGATPAALLAGAAPDQDFVLQAQASQGGIDWVQATPRAPDGALQAVRIGFRGKALAAVEIVDAFGQRSLLEFGEVSANVAIAEAAFRFVPPKGADLIEQ
jgi:outer membrane lipoprotein carrier protein